MSSNSDSDDLTTSPGNPNEDLSPTRGDDQPIQPDSPSQSLRQIGPYKLLEQIGEGGMGVVWIAEQEEPVRRRVALKLIKRGMAGKQVIARFEAERQAVAMMGHPNIAKILDAGSTETGNPYFVMELVNGEPINKYCDQNKLTLDERLRLFVPVCKAVQHAHQKGILHRDLKPSNVLVQTQDGEAAAKIIDFGLAKALQHQATLTDETMVTELGQVIGTLQYMSPEQASMDEMNVDTRSDIYSLGVMLYELLTGSTPVEKKSLKEVPLLQLLAAIREKEPPKPSQRLSDSDEQISTISELRRIQPAKLRQILRGELDWIVMKALEMDRTRRYETASDFAQDINNYLSGDTVNACPPSTRYQLQKFARKHKGLVASLLAVGLALLAGIAGTSFGLIRANQETTIAQLKTEEAERERKAATDNEVKAIEAQQSAEAAQALAAAESQRARDSETAGKFQLANARWETERAAEARDLLHDIPAEYRDNFEWHFCKRHFQGSNFTCYGHTDRIAGLAFSPDGKLIATGSYDKTIKIWDAASGAEITTLKGHTSKVFCLTFSPDGSRIVSGGSDRKIAVWDVASGALITIFKEHTRTIKRVVFSPDGSRFVSGSEDRTIKIWDAVSFECIGILQGHTGEIKSLDYSPDGTRLVSGDDNNIVKLWDMINEVEISSLEGHTEYVKSVAFSPDGSRFASGSDDKTVRIWDAASGALINTLKGHLKTVASVKFSPDGTRIASGSGDTTIKIWDAFTGEKIMTLAGHAGRINSCMAFSPDGTRIASGSSDSTVRVWDATGGAGGITLKGHSECIKSVGFSADGKRIASGSDDNTIKIWDAVNHSEIATLEGHAAFVGSVAFGPNGARIASGSDDRTIKIWDALSGEEIITLEGHTDIVNSVAFSPDGARIASGSNDNTIKIWNADSGEEIITLKGHENFVWSVTFSPDGTRIASGSQDKTVKIWDAGSGEEIITLEGHGGYVKSVAFSPDGTRFASAGRDHTIKTWDVVSGAELATFRGHTETIACLAFNPDGSRIVSGSWDKTIRIWDAIKGAEIATLKGHTDRVYSIALGPEGSPIASGSSDSTIKIWDAPYDSEIITLKGHTDFVTNVRLSPDGTTIYSQSANGEKLVWNRVTQKIVDDAGWVDSDPEQPGPQTSPDGHWFVTRELDNVILVDLDYKNTEREKSYREVKARFARHWHQAQVEKATSANNWFAAMFHLACLIKNQPDQTALYDDLHAAYEKMLAESKQEDAKASDFLPAVVKQAMELPRGRLTD